MASQIEYESFDQLRRIQDVLPFFVDFEKIPFVHDEKYHDENALWLCELARLSYILVSDQVREECKKVNLEIEFFDNDDTQAIIVSDSEKMCVVFRGTETTGYRDILTDITFLQEKDKFLGKVHEGVKNALDKVWLQIESYILQNRNNRKLYYSGHSLGSMLATLAASRLDGTALYTFGSARVGDATYALYLDAKIPHYRFLNEGDIFGGLPPKYMGWHHSGELHLIVSDVLVQKTGWVKSALTSEIVKKLARFALIAFWVVNVGKTLILEFIAEHNVVSYNLYLRDKLNLSALYLPPDFK
jgi:hypothetical protein